MERANQLFIANAQTSQQTYSSGAHGNNMSLFSPSVEDMNRIMIVRDGADLRADREGVEQSPLFGRHIKEAVEIIKDWLETSK